MSLGVCRQVTNVSTLQHHLHMLCQIRASQTQAQGIIAEASEVQLISNVRRLHALKAVHVCQQACNGYQLMCCSDICCLHTSKPFLSCKQFCLDMMHIICATRTACASIRRAICNMGSSTDPITSADSFTCVKLVMIRNNSAAQQRSAVMQLC